MGTSELGFGLLAFRGGLLRRLTHDSCPLVRCRTGDSAAPPQEDDASEKVMDEKVETRTHAQNTQNAQNPLTTDSGQDFCAFCAVF